MKTCFSTLSCPDWPWTRVVEEASRLGFDGIEPRVVDGGLDLPSAAPFQPDRIDDTRHRLAARGLAIPCLGSGAVFHDADRFDASLEEGLACIELAQRLGAPYVRVFGDRLPAGTERGETLARIVRGIGALCRACEGTAVMVLHETHGDFSHVDPLMEVAVRVADPHYGVLWDVEHTFRAYGGDLSGFLSRAWPLVRHVHLKDSRTVDGVTTPCLVGRGDVPLRSILALLDQLGYDGHLSLEWEKKWHPEIEEPEIALPDYLGFLASNGIAGRTWSRRTSWPVRADS
jgi:sugar phosphate isomerase/epimerase